MFRKIIAALSLIIGIGCISASIYIMNEVNEGKLKIKEAEQTIEQGNQLFSINPTVKELSKGITDSVQDKIDSGKEQINYYTQLAGNLKLSGIVLIVLGAGLFFIAHKKRKR